MSAAAFAAESAHAPGAFLDYYAFYFEAGRRAASGATPSDLLASALRQFAASDMLPAAGENDTDYGARMRAFVDSVQQFLKQTEPAARSLSQDGATYSYTLQTKPATARLDRSHDGWVTLGAYRKAPPAPDRPSFLSVTGGRRAAAEREVETVLRSR